MRRLEFMPRRVPAAPPLRYLTTPRQEFLLGAERPVSTTMAFVRILMKLLRDPEIGRRIVPIVPDEARTFGMDGLFRQIGIYSSIGQKYEPVDADNLLYYREARDGQILEEGITEAGAMSSFLAAGTAYATHGIAMIPFFIYYSMFGMQRIGDLVWAGGDMRARGFLVGGTAGRTTLAGEGLQHQDGHSHLLAMPTPNLRAYDPDYAYELAVILQDGIRRMYEQQEDCYYYITVGNETYPCLPCPRKKACAKAFSRACTDTSRRILKSRVMQDTKPCCWAAVPYSMKQSKRSTCSEALTAWPRTYGCDQLQGLAAGRHGL